MTPERVLGVVLGKEMPLTVPPFDSEGVGVVEELELRVGVEAEVRMGGVERLTSTSLLVPITAN
jgi:hypothetical protein